MISRLNPSVRSKKHDWLHIKAALADFSQQRPHEFASCILIGGAAALAYRAGLQASNLSDFVVNYPLEDDSRWVSSDADFINPVTEPEVLRAQCPPEWVKHDETGRWYLEVQGVKVSFTQGGVTFDPEEAAGCAVYVNIGGTQTPFQCAILNPILLYRDKKDMIEKGRGKENDPVHLEVAKVYSAFYLGQLLNVYLKKKTPASRSDLQAQLKMTQDKAPEILSEPILKKLVAEALEANPDSSTLIRKMFSFAIS
jgi:hypothetical protein